MSDGHSQVAVGSGSWARFDDLRAGTALLFSRPREVLIARRPAEVIHVLEQVESATEAGRWAFGYVSYESAGAFDPSLVVHPTSPDSLPLAWFALTDAPASVPPIDTSASAAPAADGPSPGVRWWPGWTPDEHRRDVDRIRSRIERGDTYQCNLTVRMHGRLTGDPLDLYANLATGQRGAYNAYLDLGQQVIASASPELFFERCGDELVLRPMKGTAARGRTTTEDQRQAHLLSTSTKERAENIMIVDLIRNDASRVAELGGVSVEALCEVERYETVFQLTSTVLARLRRDVGLVELFRVLFPSGSVTGTPKVSTMALIRELEETPRGVYCGAVGFVAPPDATVRARFNVAIRTAVADRSSGAVEYGVGGGITWSSDPAAEHQEVLDKTAVLHRRHREFELLETLRYEPGLGLRNRDRHLARLADSAAYFRFRADQVSTALPELEARLAVGGPARVRLRLSRAGQLSMDVLPLPVSSGVVALAVDHEPVDSTSSWLYHKTSLREPYESRQRRHPEADDVIMVNERGELTETAIASLAVHLDGRWWTPELSSGCLPGVERGRLLVSGELTERVLTLADLERTTDLAVVSSLRGWRPAVLLWTAAVPRRTTP